MAARRGSALTAGFSASVRGFDDGASGCEQIEGSLKKKNKYGVWQTRFFWVNNQYLNYGPDKSKHEVSKSFNLQDVSSLDIKDKYGVLQLTFIDGTELSVKASNVGEANHWCTQLRQRVEYYQRLEKEMDLNHVEDNDEDEADFTGWLKKKSPGIGENWQERWVEVHLGRGTLSYYKHKSNPGQPADPQGVVHLSGLGWCRMFNKSDVCDEFEFISGDRAFRFKADAHAKAEKWVKVIRTGMKRSEARGEEEHRAKEALNASQPVREYDSYATEEGRLDAATEAVDMLFMSCDGQDIACVTQAVGFAAEELTALVEDTKAETARPARLDVLSFHLSLYHERCESEIMRVVGTHFRDTASNNDIYQLIEVIQRYSAMLTEISSHLAEEARPPNAVIKMVGALSDQFVGLPEEQYPNGVVSVLKGIFARTAEHQMRVGGTEVRQNFEDGEVFTTIVSDVWSHISTQRGLARKTGSAALRYRVIEASLGALRQMIQKLKRDNKERGATDQNLGAAYICATINNVNGHMQQLEDLMATLEDDGHAASGEVRSKIGPLVEATQEALTDYAGSGVSVLSSIIIADLRETFDKFFDADWASGNSPAEVVTATIDDYLSEYEASLTDYWVSKLALDATARAVVTYIKRLEANLHPMKKSKAFLMGRYLKLKSTGVVERIKADMDEFETKLSRRLSRGGGGPRPGPFRMLDDIKVMLDGDTDVMLATILAAAATIPGNAPEGMGLRQGLEAAVERWVKARADIQSKASKQLIAAANDGIAAVVDQRNSVGGAGGPEDNGLRPFDRICLYAQVYAGGGFDALGDEAEVEQVANSPTAQYNEEKHDEMLVWIQHVDQDLDKQKGSMLSRIHSIEQEYAAETASKLVAKHPLKRQNSAAVVTHLEGYWSKENPSGGIFRKRWVVVDSYALPVQTKSNSQSTLTLSWYEKPNQPLLHGLQLKQEPATFYAKVSESTQPVVQVASTGLYALKAEHKKRAREWGPAKKVSLGDGMLNVGTLMNVLNIVTPERTVRLQGEDPHLVVEWANTINTLIKGGGDAGGPTRQGLETGERPSLNGGSPSRQSLSKNGRPSLMRSGSGGGSGNLVRKSKPPPPKGLPPAQRRRPSQEPDTAEVQNVMRASSFSEPLEPPTPPGQVENVMQGMAATPREGEGGGMEPVHVVAFKVGLSDMTMEQFNESKRANFRHEIALRLGVPMRAVQIEASAGSVNVDVTVKVADAASAQTLAATAEGAKVNIVDPIMFGPCEVSGIEVKVTEPARRAGQPLKPLVLDPLVNEEEDHRLEAPQKCAGCCTVS